MGIVKPNQKLPVKKKKKKTEYGQFTQEAQRIVRALLDGC